ncbi:TSUP family transporter [Maridesulfovibrio sp. FT414]|uniref:TSUP family transporter n=1 Tax=Maridesulfovibrio sp. FT414 TaxID=2979469 RepID=UPI003D803A2B
MKSSSGLYFSVLVIAAAILFFPDLPSADLGLKLPNIIGNVNNPYILPESGEPGFWISAAIGLVAGLLSSAIGAGGGLIVVPALMSTGISGIYAIGSEIFRVFIFSTIQSIRMGIIRRINYMMALYLTIGTTIGGLGGYRLSKTVFMADPAGSDIFVSSMIALWLIVYSFIIVPEFREAAHDYALELMRKEKGEQEREAAVQIEKPAPATKEGEVEGGEKKEDSENESESKTDGSAGENTHNEDELFPDEKPWPIAKTIRTMKFPPYMKFPGTIKNDKNELEPALVSRRGADLDAVGEPESYDRIPVIPAVLLSIVGGFFMSLTGSGGVILTYTILTKGFGCVAAFVAGTDLARLAVASGTLTMSTYGLDGFINIYCITGLVFGTSTGLHMGSRAMQNILPYRVKGLIALLVISVILNRLLSLPYQLIKAGASISAGLASTLDQSGNWILMIGAATFCGWFIYSYVDELRIALIPPEERTNETNGEKQGEKRQGKEG